MKTFIIKEVEMVSMAYEYEVQANTKEEAEKKYIEELAGSLECVNSYVADGSPEGITAREVQNL